MKKTLSLTLILALSLALLSPVAAASQGSSRTEGNEVVLIVRNVYVSMNGSGASAVRFTEEEDPENIIYSEWNDWFLNATYSSGTVPQGTQLSLSVVDGAIVTELMNDGVIHVVFLVDGNPFEVNMSAGARFAALKTADAEYILLEDETKAFQ
ncbi:MAG: hypothetical protein FWG37_03370 [Clostridia bacterium]|nr:hypothetical protein [Clostridia bacterium]